MNLSIFFNGTARKWYDLRILERRDMWNSWKYNFVKFFRVSTSNCCGDVVTSSRKECYSSSSGIISSIERRQAMTRATKTTINFTANIRAPPGFGDVNPNAIMIPRKVMCKKTAEDLQHLEAESCPPKHELPRVGVGNVWSKDSIANLRHLGAKTRETCLALEFVFLIMPLGVCNSRQAKFSPGLLQMLLTQGETSP